MNSKARTLLSIVLVAAVAASIVAINGFHFPHDNNVFHLPIVLEHFESEEGPHDPYTESLQNFTSYFWPLLKVFANEDNVFDVFLAAHLATIILLAGVFVRFVGSSLWQSKPTGFGLALAASVLAVPAVGGYSILGRNEIIVSYLTHSQVVVPFALLGLYLALRRSYVACAAVLGVAFNINAFVAVWIGVAAGIAMLAEQHHQPIKRRLGTAVAMFLTFLIVSAPTLAWILDSRALGASTANFDFVEFLREYYPFHSLIDVQPANAIATVLLLTWMWAALLAAGSRLGEDGTVRSLIAIGATLTGIMIFGSALPYITSSPLLNNLYPLRMDTYVWLFLVVCSAAFIARPSGSDSEIGWRRIALFSCFLNGNALLAVQLLREPAANFSRRLVTLLIAVAYLAALVLLFLFAGQHWALDAAPMISGLAMIFVVLQLLFYGAWFGATNQAPSTYAPSMLAWAPLLFRPDDSIAAVATAAVVLLSLAAPRSNRQLIILVSIAAVAPLSLIFATGVSAPLLLALAAPGILWLTILATRFGIRPPLEIIGRRFAAAASLAVLCLLGVTAVSGRGGLHHLPEPQIALVQMQFWARQNTPPDTMFLPVGVEGFAAFSRRPVWVDWKLGATAIWQPALYDDWSNRLATVRKLRSVSDALQLAEDVGIHYVIVFNGLFPDINAFPDRVEFQNPYFSIFRAGPEGERDEDATLTPLAR